MYKLTNTAEIIRLSDGASIPAATGNRDYDEYVAWVSAGNTPRSADQRSFQDAAKEKLARVNEGKNTALDGGFMYDGVLWDSDSKARLAYLELATQVQMDPSFTTPWKASTRNWRTMDAALFAALIPVYRAHVQACFAWQAAREQDVAVAVALAETDEAAARLALDAINETM